jgi:hypothetical protein
MVVLMESCVLCDVYTGSCLQGHAMGQAVNCQPLTRVAHVRYQASPYEICNGQSGIRTGFSPSIWVSPVSVISSLLHKHLHFNITHIRRISSKAMLLWISRSMQQNSAFTVGLSLQKVQVITFFNNLLSSVKKLPSDALHYSASTLLYSNLPL